MFCSIKKVPGKGEFKDKLEDIRYRVYVCERKRIDGKVKSIDKLICTLDYIDLTEVKVRALCKKLENCIKDKFKLETLDGEYKKVYDAMTDKVADLKFDLEDKIEERDREFIKERQKQAREQQEQYEKYSKGFGQSSSGILLSGVDDTTKEMIQSIIKEGYKKLSHKYHPDKGGSTEGMQKLNKTKEYLDSLF